MRELSQHEKILKHMKTDPDRWWLPADFMRPELGPLFVGYEASARLSELAKEGSVDSRRQGKYMARRLAVERPAPPPAPVVEKPSVPEPDQAALFSLPADQPRRYMP